MAGEPRDTTSAIIDSKKFSTSSPTQLCVPVTNPDGSNILSGTTATTVESRSSSSTVSSVSASASNVTLLASNSNRRMATFFNDSLQVCYVKVGSATASTTSYTVQMQPYDYYELPYPVCTGIVDGIWTSASGSMRITEW